MNIACTHASCTWYSISGSVEEGQETSGGYWGNALRCRRFVHLNSHIGLTLTLPSSSKSTSSVIATIWRQGSSVTSSEQLPRSEARLLRQDLELLEELSEQIQVGESWLAEASQMDERVAWLQSLPGIGRFLALVILAEIDTIERFPKAAKLVSYAGLVPSTYASGGRCGMG